MVRIKEEALVALCACFVIVTRTAKHACRHNKDTHTQKRERWRKKEREREGEGERKREML